MLPGAMRQTNLAPFPARLRAGSSANVHHGRRQVEQNNRHQYQLTPPSILEKSRMSYRSRAGPHRAAGAGMTSAYRRCSCVQLRVQQQPRHYRFTPYMAVRDFLAHVRQDLSHLAIEAPLRPSAPVCIPGDWPRPMSRLASPEPLADPRRSEMPSSLPLVPRRFPFRSSMEMPLVDTIPTPPVLPQDGVYSWFRHGGLAVKHVADENTANSSRPSLGCRSPRSASYPMNSRARVAVRPERTPD